MNEQRDWYDTPLYYDIIFDADTPKEGAFLDELHERFGRGGKSRQMLEPACGSGRLVLEMARRGWKVSGFDGNERMLTEKDAVACLQRVAAALKPGAIFALGVHLTDYTNTKEDHERWVAERDGIHVTCNTHTWPADRRRRVEDIRTRLTICDDGRRHVQETRWQFRTYNAAQLRALLRKVPAFELLACYDFTYDIESPRELDDSYSDVVLVLKKGTD